MAATEYTRITDLTPVTELKPDDDFMLSRPVNQDGNYASYRCEYSRLSSHMAQNVEDKCKVAIDQLNKLSICTDYNDLKQSGTRLVQENVIYTIKQQGGSSGGSYLQTNTTTEQSVLGRVQFNSIPRCGTTDGGNSTDIVNVQTLTSYVASAKNMSYMYGSTFTPWRFKPSTDVFGVPYKVLADSIVQVIVYSTQALDFGVFARCSTCGGTVDDWYKEAQSQIDTGNIDDDWHFMHSQKIAVRTPTVIELPIKRDNVIAFFPSTAYDASTGTFSINKAKKFAKNTLTLTVYEYK